MNLHELRKFIRKEIENLYGSDIVHENMDLMDEKTVMFCEGLITEKEFFDHIDGVLNENWLADIKNWIVEKVIKVLYSFVQQAAKFGYYILSKIISGVQYIMGKISNFADKHPALWRAIVIIVVLFIAFVATAASAKAATTGDPPNTDLINQAIGFIKNTKGIDDGQLKMKILAYLVDIRDGHQDISSDVYGQKVIDMANTGMNTIKSMAKAGGDDSSLLNMLTDYAKQGSELVGGIIEKSGGREAVRLVNK